MSGWVLMAIGASVASAVQRTIARWAIHRHGRAGEFAVAYQIVCAVLALPIGIVGAVGDNNWSVAVAGSVAASAALWMVFSAASFQSDRFLEASRKASVSRLRLVWSLVLGIVVFGERVNWWWLPGVTILVAGTIVALRHAGAAWRRGLAWELLSSVAIAGAFAFDKVSLDHLDPATVLFLSFAIPAAVMSAATARPRSRRPDEPPFWRTLAPHAWPVAAAAGAMLVSSYLQLAALAHGSLSAVVPLASLSTVVTVILGVAVLGERDDLGRKTVGLVTTILAASLLALA